MGQQCAERYRQYWPLEEQMHRLRFQTVKAESQEQQAARARESHAMLELTEARLVDVQMQRSHQGEKLKHLEVELQNSRRRENRLALRDCEYIKQIQADRAKGEIESLREEVGSSRNSELIVKPSQQMPARLSSRPQSARSKRLVARSVSGSGTV